LTVATPAANGANGTVTPHHDERLAGRARRGDLGALALLLSRWQDPILRFCRRFTVSEEDARDVAQDVMLRTTEGIETYDDARPFAPWIYRVAKNTCLNYRAREDRRRMPRAASDAPSGTLPPDELVSRREEARRVRRAIRSLDEDDRRLLTMKLVRGKTNTEIADAMGITPGALRTRACRALARLRGLLSGEVWP
jgi:RNA polymerase sigma-70 factor (ECF subfamily)